MTHWDDVRRAAREHRAAALASLPSPSSIPSAELLLNAADTLTQLERRPVPGDDSLLDGGQAVLDLESELIWYSHDVEERLARFYQVHEYAHYWLHRDTIACREADLDTEASEEPIPLGVERVEGYGPLERREREANIFAREFLLPTDALRDWYIGDGLDALAIAERVGLPAGLVIQQVARALLTPEIAGRADKNPPAGALAERPLDSTQAAASRVIRGPLLLKAGPGTGKTRTLVGRIAVLLERDVAPSAILALTFSNRAAEEMRARVALAYPEEARNIWMGTFHAFGLELLRKYGSRIGLPPRPEVLDPVDAVSLLEGALRELELDHYQNLYEPTVHLRDILAAISRAKDELVEPTHYFQLAEAMRQAASGEPEIDVAEKALEVARVYAYYQARLDEAHQLDFGDLIHKAVLLLRLHGDVRARLRRTYQHILVDEYQDVNRASGLLLREIACAGQGLWVVGDERQAIYRFRGASPANMRFFEQDFPGGQVLSLGRNYRSQPPIVDVFSALAPKMRVTAGRPFTGWIPERPLANGEVRLEIAEDLTSEAQGIAREIERHRAAGITYRDQAILCRSHTSLGRIGAALELAGVPVLYLGDVFERPEVRDMLALLELACEPDGRGLVRVARFPEYHTPLGDVRALRQLASDKSIPFPRALRLAASAEGITEEGKRGLALLERHLDGLSYGIQPWALLVNYLFVRSHYLREVVADMSVVGQQRRLALYQFLQFVHDQRLLPSGGDSGDPKRRLLRYVRQLEIFGEEKQLRQVPSWAESIDAVRLLTVHASKGLEFRVVYLPTLGQGYFPARKQARPCPPPAGMLDVVCDDHEEEEECLFFVALSRARDALCLSRAVRYGKQNSSASSLLRMLEEALPQPVRGAPTWHLATLPSLQPPESGRALVAFDARQLDMYLRCPRQFYYEFMLGLSGKREDSAYVQFHLCVYRVLLWMHDERAAGRKPNETAALAKLAEVWQKRGPHDHLYEAMYRRSAENMVTHWAGRPMRRRSNAIQAEWAVDLPHGRVTLVPDHLEQLEDGSEIVERLRTGRPTKSELDKDIYGLYVAAAREAHPRVSRKVQIRYLSNDVIQPVELKEKAVRARLDRYDGAIAGILREEFPPAPNERNCPRCPHYFICPLAEDR